MIRLRQCRAAHASQRRRGCYMRFTAVAAVCIARQMSPPTTARLFQEDMGRLSISYAAPRRASQPPSPSPSRKCRSGGAATMDTPGGWRQGALAEGKRRVCACVRGCGCLRGCGPPYLPPISTAVTAILGNPPSTPSCSQRLGLADRPCRVLVPEGERPTMTPPGVQ